MATPIKPKRTFTANKVPTTADLQDGEMGINVPDGRIYVRQGSTVQLVGSKEQGGINSITADPGVSNGLRLYANTSGDHVSIGITDPPGLPTNYFLSAPQTLGGTHTFRAIDTSDLPAFTPEMIPFPQNYINGLYVSTTDTAVVVSPGEAYIPSIQRVLQFAGTTITTPRAANTTYHLYLSITGSVSRSTTAPGDPYYLTARRSGTINSSRYLGSVCTDASGNYIRQASTAGNNSVYVALLNNTTSNSLVGNGNSTVPVDLSAAAWAPSTAVGLRLRIQETSTTSTGLIRVYGYDGSSFVVWTNLPFASTYVVTDVPCDSTPKIQYDVTNTARRTFISIQGYTYER